MVQAHGNPTGAMVLFALNHVHTGVGMYLPKLSSHSSGYPKLTALINSQFLTTEPDTPLLDVIALIGKDNQTALSSCILIVEDTILTGILTAWDIVCLVTHQTSLEGVVAGDIMSHPVITLAEDDLEHLRRTPSVFYQHQIRHLPVINQQGIPVGVITPDSLQQVLQPSNLPKLLQVGDVMTTECICIHANDSIANLAQLMTAQRSDVIMVVTGDVTCNRIPVGFTTAWDVVRLQARGLSLNYITVQTVMHPLSMHLSPSDSLWFAHQEMQQQQVPCLPILDDQGTLLGLISDLDLLRAGDPAAIYRSKWQLQRSMQQLKTDRVHVLQHRRTSELERLIRDRTAQLEEQSKCDRLLAATTLRIHQSLDLQDILFTTVSEVRQLLQTDRAIICRLDPEKGDSVVVESVLPGWTPMLGRTIQSMHVYDHWLEAYRNGHIQVIEDVYNAGLDPQHVENLAQFQVRAMLIVPIVMSRATREMGRGGDGKTEASLPISPPSAPSPPDSYLWGVLIAHHCTQTRRWQQWEISLLEQLTKQVGIAIHQSELHQQVQTELQERRRIEAELASILNNLEQTVQERTASWQEVADRLILEIAERKRAEAELTQTSDQLLAVLDAVPGMVSWISSDLNYLGVNRHLADAFNLPPSEFIGKPVGFLYQSSRFTDFLQQFFASSSPTIVQDIVLEETDDTIHNYLVVAQKYNQNQAAVVVGIDITEHKQAGKALQESEAKFRDLVEQTNDWVWELDLNLHFTYVNPRVSDLIGYEPEEVLGYSMVDFMLTDEAVRLHTVLDYCIHQKEAFSQIETTLIHKAGHPIVLEISGMPVFDPHGTLQGYRGITRDITERKQVELNIRKALTKEKDLNELKTRFISMASHEFRTPLTAILASAESLERYRDKWTASKQQTVLQRIQSAAKHMTGLLNDVLLVGKADAGKLECKLGILNLEEFCADLVEEVCIGNSNTCRIHFTSSGNCTHLLLDEKLLRPILTNLLSNALKYSPVDSTVRFTLSHEDDRVIMQVIDQGIGIPLDDQKRLFESFHRATNVGNIPGTGLGLTIVKNAVKAHGGKVTVSSQLGAGTTFTVSIPLTKGGNTNEKDSCN